MWKSLIIPWPFAENDGLLLLLLLLLRRFLLFMRRRVRAVSRNVSHALA